METVDILGVKISNLNYQSAIEQVEHFLAGGGRHFVVTPNPEFVVLAQKDKQFRQILNHADLAITDGVGLRMAAKFLSLPTLNFTIVKIIQALVQGFAVGLSAIVKPSYLDILSCQVTGTDLMVRLCRLAAEKGYTVFLLGAQKGVAEAAAKRLTDQFANLKIVGTYSGDPGEEFDEQTRSKIVQKLEARSWRLEEKLEARGLKSSLQFLASYRDFGVQPPTSSIDLLFVAYGAPAQERWIARNLAHLPVKVAVGVGGAFDFVSGQKKRAPRLLRQVGLEWLYRLLQEPQRLPRILTATVIFPLLVFRHKLNN